MAFVLDASIAASWAFGDEADARAEAALALIGADFALVPSLWHFEIANILIVGERRRRIAEPDAAIFLRHLARLDIRTQSPPDLAPILTLARSHRLTAYDAAYLDLARRETLPLATLDGALAAAARAERVSLIG